MMKSKSSIKRTRRGYTLRLTKREYEALILMVDMANKDGDAYEWAEAAGDTKAKLKAIERVTALLLG